MKSLSWCGSGAVQVAAALAVVGSLSRPAMACDPPRVVSLDATLSLEEGNPSAGFASLTAYFQDTRATFFLIASSLPAPASGAYGIVLSTPLDSLELGEFTVDPDGSASLDWYLPLDLRTLALNATSLELWDLDQLGAATPVVTRAQNTLRAFANRNTRRGAANLSLVGFIERRAADFLVYDFKITGNRIPRGEYTLELWGPTDIYTLSFSPDADFRVDVRIRGTDQDLIARAVLWEEVRVYRNGVFLASLPLDCGY